MDSLRTVCYIHWVLYTGCGVHHVTGTYTINGDLVDRSTKTPSNGVYRACCALPTTTAPQSCYVYSLTREGSDGVLNSG